MKRMKMNKVFISYSRKDFDFKDKVVLHLKILEPQADLEIWSDDKIQPGGDWFGEIKKSLSEAKVIIMLISANFLTSQFILHVEVPRILERRKNDGATVIPILIKPCAWQSQQWLTGMQITPDDGKALSEKGGPQRDKLLAHLVIELKNILNSKNITPNRGEVHPLSINQKTTSSSIEKDRNHNNFEVSSINIFDLPATYPVYFVGNYKEIKIEHLWEKMKAPSQLKNILVFFGGISTKLRQEDADDHYIEWLIENENAKLFICYESGDCAKIRRKTLDGKTIKDSIDINTWERMNRKEREVKNLKERLSLKLKKINHEEIEDRIYFIALTDHFLTSYVIVADIDVYFTPLINKRSSETVSFDVSTSPRYLLDFLEYIKSCLEGTELSPEMDRKDFLSATNQKNIRILYEEINKILTTLKDEDENNKRKNYNTDERSPIGN